MLGLIFSEAGNEQFWEEARTSRMANNLAMTAVRISQISAAQNKRGKDCFEGGMESGSFTWFKDMGGNSNWMYIKVINVSPSRLSLALWLLYEAATEPMVDPLTASGALQVGFFNQSKNLNRQVPLFELAEESKPGLELAAGQTSTLKVRINDLSSHHQNQRFIIVIGPSDAPIRGSRSVPIEIMSKPRIDPEMQQQHAHAQASVTLDAVGAKRAIEDVSSMDGNHHPAKRLAMASAEPLEPAPRPTGAALLSALVLVTDPLPTARRQVDLILALLEGLEPQDQLDLHERLGEKIARRAASSTEGGECESDSADDPARRGPRQLRPIVKAILAFKQLQADAKARREASKQAAQPLEAGTSSLSAPPGGALAVGGASAVGGAGFKTDDATVPGWVKDAVESGRLPPHDQLALSEEQLEDFFVDESSGLSILDIVSPRTAQVNKPQPPPLVTNAAAPTQV